MTQPKPTDAPDPLVAAPAPSGQEETIGSEDILRGRNSVTIEHRGTRYRLQETKAGKLILTK